MQGHGEQQHNAHRPQQLAEGMQQLAVSVQLRRSLEDLQIARQVSDDKDEQIAPVTAITAFLPLVEPQKPGARASSRTPIALVLMLPTPSYLSRSSISCLTNLSKITSSATNSAGTAHFRRGYAPGAIASDHARRLRNSADRCGEATYHYRCLKNDRQEPRRDGERRRILHGMRSSSSAFCCAC